MVQVSGSSAVSGPCSTGGFKRLVANRSGELIKNTGMG